MARLMTEMIMNGTSHLSRETIPCKTPYGRLRAAITGFCAAFILLSIVVPQPLLSVDEQAENIQEQAAASDADSYGWSYQISGVDLLYTWEHPDNPSIDKLLNRSVKLRLIEGGWVAAAEGEEGTCIPIRAIGQHSEQRYFTTALNQICAEIVKGIGEAGVLGVYVSPHGDDIGEGGEDLRGRKFRRLRLMAELPSIHELHTVAKARRDASQKSVDAERYQSIVDNSPAAVGGLVVNKKIEEYVARLNRHPNRQVEVAIATYREPEHGRYLSLEYIVTEDKPWIAYFHLASTGSRGTGDWRETFGYRNCQLTCCDDTLTLSYVTSEFDPYHLLEGSYERPFCWCPCLHWKIGGSYNDYDSTDLGSFDGRFVGDGWNVHGELIWTCWQWCDWFIDAVSGARWQHYDVAAFLGTASNGGGSGEFLILYSGVILERCCPTHRARAAVFFESSIPSVGDISANDLVGLGRSQVTDDFYILKWDGIYALYLDPYLCSESECGYCHNLEFSVRGQTTFGDRVPSQFKYTAGGQYSVRGYDQSITSGDFAALAAAEYRLHVPCLLGCGPGQEYSCDNCNKCHSQPCTCDDCFWDVIVSAYMDYGWVHNNHALSFEREETLWGAGIGLEFVWSRHFVVRGDWAWALHDASAGETFTEVGDSRGYLSVTLMY